MFLSHKKGIQYTIVNLTLLYIESVFQENWTLTEDASLFTFLLLRGWRGGEGSGLCRQERIAEEILVRSD